MNDTTRHTAAHPANMDVRRALGFAVYLHVAWLCAWLLEQFLEIQVEILTTRESRFVYWTVAKLLLWILSAILVLRRSGTTFRETMAFDRVRAILLWGGGIGIVLGSTAIVPKMLSHQPLIPAQFDINFLSAVFIAPFVEEIAFRGVILGSLVKRWRLAIANTITAFLFLTIHMVGWSFQGVLVENLTKPVGGALSIFGIGLILGYVAHKSRSVAASTLTHMLNNLCAA